MKIRKEFIVGIFSAAGIVALILGFFYLKGESFFGDKTEYYVVYNNADGLASGNAVKLNGVQVGKVKSVALNPNDESSTLIKFSISNPDVKLPMGTVAEMKGDILGTVTLNIIYPVDSLRDGSFHKNGDTLQAQIAEDIQKTIEKKFDPLMAKINELIGTADNAIGTIETIFGDNTGNLNATFEKLNQSMTNFQHIAQNVDSLSHVLNNSKYLITSTVSNINSITGNLKESNEQITSMIDNINTISENMSKVDLQPTIDKANNALNEVALILDEIKNGDGTLTKLMQDSVLYDNVNEMLDEATLLINNIMMHPNRYLQFSVFGGKDKGANLINADEKRLKEFAKDSLRKWYP
ncbi:MlaD family protein [Parvicella tangerina]|uniref:Mce/MlaD domain-containing protein n=1 Tax=Parvicella tangerina TaxID=2829795 RepID=A0A916JNS7_9FLAO|nr:MlaD family protein [Parvicella tangerina]CAG5082696.1 hypothetical protein CRYO30217_01985 [Parvicella tangerina]